MKLRDTKLWFPSGLHKTLILYVGGTILHIDGSSLVRFAQQTQNQGAGVLLSTKALSLQRIRRQTLPQTPQPSRVRVGSGSSALYTTSSDLHRWAGSRGAFLDRYWTRGILKDEIPQDSSYFQLCRLRVERLEFKLVTTNNVFCSFSYKKL